MNGAGEGQYLAVELPVQTRITKNDSKHETRGVQRDGVSTISTPLLTAEKVSTTVPAARWGVVDCLIVVWWGGCLLAVWYGECLPAVWLGKCLPTVWVGRRWYLRRVYMGSKCIRSVDNEQQEDDNEGGMERGTTSWGHSRWSCNLCFLWGAILVRDGPKWE